jgi:hypothetical protein
MARRSIFILIAVIALAGIAYFVYPYINSVASNELDTDIGLVVDTQPINDDVKLLHGPLDDKYFTTVELARYDQSMNLDQVPHYSDVDLDHIDIGCPDIDCIPSIDNPEFELANAVWIYDEHLVIGVEFNGVSKAYPLLVITRHEIVNDTFADIPVTVAYCPLCNSATAFITPEVDGEILEFGVSGRLYKSDLVMYDRTTLSMWSQIENRVIIGPLAENSPSLKRIPIDITTWEDWVAVHPDTLVLARPTNKDAVGGQPPVAQPGQRTIRLFDYSEDPYRWYAGVDRDTAGLEVSDTRLLNKAVVVGVEIGDGKAYLKEDVETLGIINDEVDGVRVVVFLTDSGQVRVFKKLSDKTLTRDDDTLSDGDNQWSLEGKSLDSNQPSLEPLYSLPLYWFAWAANHPGTALYQAE